MVVAVAGPVCRAVEVPRPRSNRIARDNLSRSHNTQSAVCSAPRKDFRSWGEAGGGPQQI